MSGDCWRIPVTPEEDRYFEEMQALSDERARLLAPDPTVDGSGLGGGVGRQDDWQVDALGAGAAYPGHAVFNNDYFAKPHALTLFITFLQSVADQPHRVALEGNEIHVEWGQA